METVVLLCGLLCDEEVWEAQVQALREERDVRIMNFAGFDSMAGMAAEVLARSPDRFALAGHSMGGRVALEVYRQAPGRVTRLALLDTGHEAASPEETESRGRLVRQALAEGIAAIAETWARPMIAPCNMDRVLPPVLAMVARMSGEIYAGQTKALLSRPDATPVLAEIRCPTLILCGRQDGWSPPERHERMAAAVPGSLLRLIDDCGHMAMMEQPAQVLMALREWLAVG